MSDMLLLIYCLVIMSAADVYFTGTGIIYGDVLEFNPLAAWLFKLPAQTWIAVMVLANFVVLLVLGLSITIFSIGIQAVKIALLDLIIWRGFGAQSGFIAAVKHIKHHQEDNTKCQTNI